jgi:hypothetical protein
MNHRSSSSSPCLPPAVPHPAASHLFPAAHFIEPRQAGPWTHTRQQLIADQSSRVLGRSTASQLSNDVSSILDRHIFFQSFCSCCSNLPTPHAVPDGQHHAGKGHAVQTRRRPAVENEQDVIRLFACPEKAWASSQCGSARSFQKPAACSSPPASK